MEMQDILSLVLILLLITSVSIPSATAKPTDIAITNAADLQAYFDDPAGKTGVLMSDITAPIEKAFILKKNTTATLDLHGKTIIGADGIEVITIDGGNLTIQDTRTGGKIMHATPHTEGRGIFMRSGSLVMSGGNITHNQRMHGFTDWNANGAGVYVKKGRFLMTGGTISENRALAGGGVYIESGRFDMSGGTITGNVATHGGGVFAYYGDHFSMTGGTITQNTANPDCGGGVYCYNGGISFPPASSPVISGNFGKTTQTDDRTGNVTISLTACDIGGGWYLTTNGTYAAIAAAVAVIVVSGVGIYYGVPAAFKCAGYLISCEILSMDYVSSPIW